MCSNEVFTYTPPASSILLVRHGQTQIPEVQLFTTTVCLVFDIFDVFLVLRFLSIFEFIFSFLSS